MSKVKVKHLLDRQTNKQLRSRPRSSHWQMYKEYKKRVDNMASSSLKVVLFLGTVREGRLGLRVAKFMQKCLTSKGYEVDLFGEHAVPYLLSSCVFLSNISHDFAE